MHRLECPNCRARLFFENSRCLDCGTEVGFCPRSLAMVALAGAQPCAQRRGPALCNWLTTPQDGGSLCMSCALTRTLPDLTGDGATERFRRVEQAKRRLCFTLLRAGLQGPTRRMVFDLLADPQAVATGVPEVAMGHLDGVITLSLAEADPGYRERTRSDLDERYRTVLGHLRHESGHFFFRELVLADAPRLLRFRALFGDERSDYAAALQAHHAGRSAYDAQRHVTRYAAAHPHEDWAETWAHLLHILDTLESAHSLQMAAGRGTIDDPWSTLELRTSLAQFSQVMQVLNELNRSLGHGDAYPFATGSGVIDKLAFAHSTLPVFQRAASC